jgi:hypothetical protein
MLPPDGDVVTDEGHSVEHLRASIRGIGTANVFKIPFSQSRQTQRKVPRDGPLSFGLNRII